MTMTGTTAPAADRAATPAAIARRYVESVGRHDLGPLSDLLHDDLVARAGDTVSGKDEWITALGRLLPALVRNDIREVFADGDRVAVVYDFVTDTPAGAVPCVELLTVTDGSIRTVQLVFERLHWSDVLAEIGRRTATAGQPTCTPPSTTSS